MTFKISTVQKQSECVCVLASRALPSLLRTSWVLFPWKPPACLSIQGLSTTAAPALEWPSFLYWCCECMWHNPQLHTLSLSQECARCCWECGHLPCLAPLVLGLGSLTPCVFVSPLCPLEFRHGWVLVGGLTQLSFTSEK